MSVSPAVIDQLLPYFYKAAAGLVVTGLLGVIMWPLKKARKEWNALKEDLASTHAELVQQRTNCLATLQEQGKEQVGLLKETVSVLQGVRIDLAEQTGFIKASLNPPRRRTAKK